MSIRMRMAHEQAIIRRSEQAHNYVSNNLPCQYVGTREKSRRRTKDNVFSLEIILLTEDPHNGVYVSRKPLLRRVQLLEVFVFGCLGTEISSFMSGT